MAYKVIILYRLYMPSYFLGTFTEYPFLFFRIKWADKKSRNFMKCPPKVLCLTFFWGGTPL